MHTHTAVHKIACQEKLKILSTIIFSLVISFHLVKFIRMYLAKIVTVRRRGLLL